MIYSNERKLSLSAWLKNNNPQEYASPLKLQKFLFLYEAFTKTAGEQADFERLRGYRNGPVFSTVWGDYTKERDAFELKAEESLKTNKEKINIDRAKQCGFIAAVQTERELSELTHGMNIWQARKDLIERGVSQVPLYEKDFNQSDYDFIKTLGSMFPINMIEASSIIRIDEVYFVIDKQKLQELTEEHYDALSIIAHEKELHNPVYLELEEDGRLLID